MNSEKNIVVIFSMSDQSKFNIVNLRLLDFIKSHDMQFHGSIEKGVMCYHVSKQNNDVQQSDVDKIDNLIISISHSYKINLYTELVDISTVDYDQYWESIETIKWIMRNECQPTQLNGQ